MPVGPLSAGHRLGRYEVLAKVASGGMAVVYVASAQGAAGFERIVALKVLHANLAYEEEFIRMFLDEARLAARIRHPNVVPTIDISDSAETGYFLVMEYIEGDHLGALLSGAHKAGERLSVPVVLRIAIDALSGLGEAHELSDDAGRSLKLVHRDISPHNILVGRDGIARLTDFGVAKAEDRLTHTRDGQVKGKLAYMAPEQASTGQSDARSDLFSMGIVLWECVTGRRLFRADNTAATLTKLLSEEIALPSAIDPALEPLDAMMRKALQRDPEARFQTAEEFIEAIEVAARRAGGVASRRGVSQAVKVYAADKLARDRKLISSAKRVLRGGVPLAGESASEPTPSASEISLPSSSISRPKPGGVLSNLTTPGLFMRSRSSRSAPARTGEPIPEVRGLLQPPPPLGAMASLDFRRAPFASLGMEPDGGSRTRLWLLLAVLVSLLAVAILVFGPQSPSAAPASARPRTMVASPPAAPPASAPVVAAPTSSPVPDPRPPRAVAAPVPVRQPSEQRSEPEATATDETTPEPSAVGAARRSPRWTAKATHGEPAQIPSLDNAGAKAPPSESPQDLLPNPYKR